MYEKEFNCLDEEIYRKIQFLDELEKENQQLNCYLYKMNRNYLLNLEQLDLLNDENKCQLQDQVHEGSVDLSFETVYKFIDISKNKLIDAQSYSKQHNNEIQFDFTYFF